MMFEPYYQKYIPLGEVGWPVTENTGENNWTSIRVGPRGDGDGGELSQMPPKLGAWRVPLSLAVALCAGILVGILVTRQDRN